jgi:hypothetical protein
VLAQQHGAKIYEPWILWKMRSAALAKIQMASHFGIEASMNSAEQKEQGRAVN